MNNNPVLCYVSDQWAYFTTQKLEDQWGSDWNDAPYEHNAGEPNEFSEHASKLGKEPWEITKVAFDGPFESPRDGQHSSQWSVEQINAGAVAWLRSPRLESGKIVTIQAGTTLEDFCRLIKQGGGTVYMPRKDQ